MKFQPIAAALLGLLVAATASAQPTQYKIVGPDGRITYTDRPPVDASGKLSAIGRSGAAAASTDNALPFELRQVASRYPVTLYAGERCPPCDNARTMLQQRGIPYVERRIVSEEDQQALERLVGGRTIPSMTVGVQPLRGYFANDWMNFLDAAGYPRESKLPRNWQPPAPTPLTERVAAQRQASAAAAPEAPPPAPPPPAPAPTADAPTIRF